MKVAETRIMLRGGGEPRPGVAPDPDDRDLVVEKVRSLRVERTSGLEADIFAFSIPNKNQEYTQAFKSTSGKRVEIRINGQVKFTGFCDSATFQVIPEPLLEVEGRDWTGIAIDEVMTAELAAKLQGKTASGVAIVIAKHLGWTYDVDATTEVYGEYKAFAEGVSLWEAMRDLALKEAFDAYVTPEKKLVFKPRVLPAVATRIYAVPAPSGAFSANAQVPTALSFYQDKTLTLALKVKVIGYDAKAKRRIAYTAESKLRNRPNYRLIEIVDYTLQSAGEVRSRAMAELTQISKGLVAGELLVPVDEGLEPGQAIQISGAGPFSDKYYVTAVVHQQDEAGEFATGARFASKPLMESREMEIEQEPELKTVPQPGKR